MTIRLNYILQQIAFHERTKHIEVDYHLVRNKILEGMIKTFHVATNSQVADIFTKTLGFSSFVRLLDKLGLKDIFQPKPLKEMPKQLKVASLVLVSKPKTLDLRGSVEENRACSLQVENDRGKGRFKGKTTKERKRLKRGVLVNELTRVTHVTGKQKSVVGNSCQFDIS